MQSKINLILSALIGGVFALGGFLVIQPHTQAYKQNMVLQPVSLNGASAVAAGVPFDFTVASEKAKKSVVYIETKSDPMANQRRQDNSRRQSPRSMDDLFDIEKLFRGFQFDLGPREGKGSGVILTADGLIVTNNHVINNADEINIKTYDDRKFVATKIGVDPSTDLAILKIDATNLTPVEIGNSDALRVGEWVLAVGNPFNLDFTVTAGIVSAKGRNKLNLIQDAKPIEEFIQTDAAVNPGNSGGALVDVNGKLVGINTAIYSPDGSFAGYSFAIPVNLMQKVVMEIKTNGSVERVGSLGIEIHEIDETLAKEQNLPSKKGLLIKSVQEGSIADYGGLIPDDIILQVDGKDINTFDQLVNVRDESRVGQVLQVKIMRDGEIKTLPVKLRKKV
ncbi:MAG: trypsin-like peptidase domain-containing protein [Saprospiraceae bacterium]|nr:trypsin-like peptidase domain-containing protein [Saprospiraceae bacterium]